MGYILDELTRRLALLQLAGVGYALVAESPTPGAGSSGTPNEGSEVRGEDSSLQASEPYKKVVKTTKSKISRRKIIGWALCLLPLAYGGVIYYFENHACNDTADKLHLWIQFLTSNWPAYDQHLDRRSAWFALIVTVRFAIVYGTVAGVISTFVKVINWQNEATLRLTDMMRERDIAIELRLSQALNPADPAQPLPTIRTAIKEADEAWAKEILPARVGPEMAKRYLEK